MSSADINAIAARALKDPGSLSHEEIQQLCDSVLTQLSDQPKLGDGTPDAALAIGEHAFRAGWEAATHQLHHGCFTVDSAWDNYEPPENIKELS